MTTKTAEIAKLNDLFRTGLNRRLGKVLITHGVCSLPIDQQMTIVHMVETFDSFTEDNNPHGERDFGAFEHAGQKVFWKIDYYDRSLTAGSEDPSDPRQTTRVLTIMLASEY